MINNTKLNFDINNVTPVSITRESDNKIIAIYDLGDCVDSWKRGLIGAVKRRFEPTGYEVYGGIDRSFVICILNKKA